VHSAQQRIPLLDPDAIGDTRGLPASHCTQLTGAPTGSKGRWSNQSASFRRLITGKSVKREKIDRMLGPAVQSQVGGHLAHH
jgi:hypothetical protein